MFEVEQSMEITNGNCPARRRSAQVFEVERRDVTLQWRTPFMPLDQEMSWRWLDKSGDQSRQSSAPPPPSVGASAENPATITRWRDTAAPKLPTRTLDFRGLDSSRILVLRGKIIMSTGNSPEVFESTNLSRDNLSREIEHTIQRRPFGVRGWFRCADRRSLCPSLAPLPV